MEADALMRLCDYRSEVVLHARQVPGQALDTFVMISIQHGVSVLTSSGPALPAVSPCSTISSPG